MSDTTTVIDTIKVAAPVIADATMSLVTSILPYLTPWSAVVAGALWIFRVEIKAFLTSRGGERKQILEQVQFMRSALDEHIAEEKGFWASQEARVKAVEDKNHELEVRLAEIAATAKAQHEAVVSKLTELTGAVMESLRRGN
jgi:hypothetical protein